MADQYTWDKAKQEGYKVDVVPLTRQTIADGNLLNSSVVEVFSSRDKYVNDNLVKETASANSVYSTVNSNSAKNWANSALQGFSAIQANSTKMPAKKLNDTLQIDVAGLETNYTNNTLTVSMPDYYADSYFQRSNRTNTQQMYDMIVPWGQQEDSSSENQGAIFGGGSTVKMYSVYSAFNVKSLIINADRCKTNGTICSVGNIQINPMDLCTAHGININALRNSDKGAIAINNSYGKSFKQLAINDSILDNTTDASWNFAMNHCEMHASYNNNVLFANSTANGHNSLSIFDSQTNNNCLAAYKSMCTSPVSIALYNSTATNNTWCYAAHNSIAENSLIISDFNSSAGKYATCSVAMYHSTARNVESISLYDSLTEYSGSVALYNSSARNYYSCALYNSTAECSFVFAAYNSYATYGVQTVCYSSVASGGGMNLAMYQSTAVWGSTIAAYRSDASHGNGGQHTLWFDSTVEDGQGGQIVLYNSHYSRKNGLGTPANILLYNSDTEQKENTQAIIRSDTYCINAYNSRYELTNITAYKKIGCAQQEVTAVYSAHPVYCIARYDSTVADNYNIAEYNSHVGCGALKAYALFDSKISATRADYNSQNNLVSTTTSATIAMFNSTAVDTLDKMLLWSNKVCIEPSGYVNKIKIIDLSYSYASVSWPTQAWQNAHPDYHTFIIG